MYEIALSAAACLRSNTRADVVWHLDTDIPRYQSSAGNVMLTPGGGRIGNLMDGIFEGQLADIASRQLPFAKVQELVVGPLEALVAGLDAGARARVVISPAHLIALDAWEAFLAKEPVLVHGRISDGVISEFATYTQATISGAPAELAAVFTQGLSTSVVTEDAVTCMFVPRTKCVIAGAGPIAQALADTVSLLGWDAVIDSSPVNVAGLTATLSDMDVVIVMGHDVESSSRCLESALQSNAGYIGALGSRAMQQNRADWLAFRDVTDLSRVHGPAGFDIGASSPHEIAVSIVAQAIAVKAGKA